MSNLSRVTELLTKSQDLNIEPKSVLLVANYGEPTGDNMLDVSKNSEPLHCLGVVYPPAKCSRVESQSPMWPMCKAVEPLIPRTYGKELRHWGCGPQKELK